MTIARRNSGIEGAGKGTFSFNQRTGKKQACGEHLALWKNRWSRWRGSAGGEGSRLKERNRQKRKQRGEEREKAEQREKTRG